MLASYMNQAQNPVPRSQGRTFPFVHPVGPLQSQIDQDLESIVVRFIAQATAAEDNAAATLSIFEQFCIAFEERIQVLETEIPRKNILPWLSTLWTFLARSPLMSRIQCWPRGYAGDFETIDYIIRNENRSEPGTMAHIVENFFLQSHIVLQHLNKVARQSEIMRDVIRQKPNARILLVGCGTSEDVVRLMNAGELGQARITLLDSDANAIAFSRRRLADVQDQLETIHGNIYKVLHKLEGQFDVVLFGGVFDYLSDRIIERIVTSVLNRNMVPGGVLFFTNIAKGNPFRISIEYLADWVLIERTATQMRDLVTKNVSVASIEVEYDATGLTHLVTVVRR